MPLKPCQGCGKEVDTTAKACPHCGRPSPTGLSGAGVVGVLVAIGAGIWLYTSLGESKPSPADPATGAAQQPKSALLGLLEGKQPTPPAVAPAQQQQAGPPIRITAAQLHREYAANEVAADAKYKGRLLLVDGTIASIDKDFTDDIVLRLRTGDQFNSANATLDSADAREAAALRKGQRVTLLCRGGTRIIGSATLDKCRLQ